MKNRRTAQSIKKKPRAAIWVLTAAAVVAAALFIYLELTRRREIVQQQRDLSRIELTNLKMEFQELLHRHSDYALAEQREYYLSFRQQSQEAQIKGIDTFRSALLDLEEAMRTRSLGNLADVHDEELEKFKTFSANGFKEFYETVDYPNTRPVLQAPEITDDPAGDRKIVRLAEQRGYRLRSIADADRLTTLGRHQLQAPAAQSWQQMQQAALAEGIQLELVSAYRSIDRQRQIFLEIFRQESIRSLGREYTAQEIGSGHADDLIKAIIASSSIPGYSKHHSGYAVDLTDFGSGKHFTDFAQTDGFQWISANNYLNAKRFGFIPSYPEGAVLQGPDPEPWEYVWVGRELLLRRQR